MEWVHLYHPIYFYSRHHAIVTPTLMMCSYRGGGQGLARVFGLGAMKYWRSRVSGRFYCLIKQSGDVWRLWSRGRADRSTAHAYRKWGMDVKITVLWSWWSLYLVHIDMLFIRRKKESALCINSYLALNALYVGDLYHDIHSHLQLVSQIISYLLSTGTLH